jgi:glycosyltransferase involved in cell wall biosynthesis
MICDPLVSILIPAYNNPEYTKKTLSSVLSQSYRPIEIIFIDDNSPTSLKPLFDEFLSNKDELISAKYFRNARNLNPYYNIMSGLDKVSGKYLIILPHDDWLVNNLFIRKSVDYMTRDPHCMVVIGNSQIEHTTKKMFLHKFATDPFQLDGKTYLSKYLFKKLHPAYSGVLMDFEQLSKLNFTEIYISENEAAFYDITPDEAFVSIALLSDKGSVLISNEVVSVRGNPKNSYSKSDEWLKSWSLGVFFPYYHLFIHFLKSGSYTSALSILRTIIRSRPTNFSQIYKQMNRNGFHLYIVLLCLNNISQPLIRFIDYPHYYLGLMVPKKIKRIFKKILSRQKKVIITYD